METPILTRVANIAPHRAKILFATSRVLAFSNLPLCKEVHALIDPCSEAIFVSESLAFRNYSFVTASGVGGLAAKQNVRSARR